MNWQKAIILWLQNKVDVLEFHSQTVSSATRSFPLPSVIRLKRYIRPYFTMKVRLTRQNLFIRDKKTCQYCHRVFSEKKLTVDHVMPLSRGGQHEWSNIVAACSPCNNKKGNKTPEEANMPLNKKPKEPRWLPGKELSWNEDRYPVSWRDYIPI